MVRTALATVFLLSGLLSGLARADEPKGVVQGTVIFEGEAPTRAKLNRDSDPYCQKTEALADDVIVTKGKLKDVLVRIANGTKLPPRAAPPAIIDQQACTYAPRVLGLVAGEKLGVRNSDGTFHNVHGTVGGKLLWNKPSAPKSPELALSAEPAAKPGDVVDVVCDVHPWMHAYAAVMDHAYFAVTGEDGAFKIAGLPPGTYTLEAWHPTLGTRTLTVKIGVGGKGTVPARFSFKAP